jgi:cation diffusion facilitator family transporter
VVEAAHYPESTDYREFVSHHTIEHRHGLWAHEHHIHGRHRHARLPFASTQVAHLQGEHGHTHGVVDPEIVRSRQGVKVVGWSLLVLALTAAVQTVVFLSSGSVALLADLVHNFGDALTAIPLGVAFFAVNRRWEGWAGYAVVAAIFTSACVAAIEAVDRLFNPQPLDHLWALALAGLVGFVGNEIAARIRLRAGSRLDSPALVADGHHARVDGFVSLAVIASAWAVALGFDRADPLIGLAITALILRITTQAWRTIRAAQSH